MRTELSDTYQTEEESEDEEDDRAAVGDTLPESIKRRNKQKRESDKWHIQRAKQTQQSQKKKKKKSSSRVSEDESLNHDFDEDRSYHRHPPSDDYLHSQKQQRINNHPSTISMGKPPRKRAGTSNSAANLRNTKARASNSEEEATDVSTLGTGSGSGDPGGPGSSGSESTRENEKSKLTNTLIKWNKDLAVFLTEPLSKKRSSKDKTMMENQVENCAKHMLFKSAKFSCEQLHAKRVQWVREFLQPQELDAFKEHPDLEAQAIEIWDKRYGEFVRLGLNAKHNDLRSSLMKVFEDMDEGGANWNPKGLPLEAKEVESLILRLGCGSGDKDRDENISKLAALADEMLPKVRQSGGSCSSFLSSSWGLEACSCVHFFFTHLELLFWEALGCEEVVPTSRIGSCSL